MMKRVIIGAIMATLLVGGVASATTVTITTGIGNGADGNAQNDSSKGPSTLGGTGTSFEVRSYDSGTGTQRVKLGVLKFDLSSLSGTASGATLSLSVKTNVGAASNAVFNVYAVTDDTVDASVLDSALSYNNLSAILSGALNTYVIDSTKTSLLGTFTVASKVLGPHVSNTTSLPLDGAINRELTTGNKLMSLLVVMTPTSASSNDVYFLTKEYGTAVGSTANVPTLTFDNVPEPATLAILGLGGLLLRRKRA